MSWNTRIVGSDMIDPSILCPNPKNWRRHPKYQQEAMTNVFNEIGWIQDIIVNKTTGNIIDGHMRAELAVKNKEKLVPVKYVELSEEEERQALITYDPLSALADFDLKMLEDIASTVDIDLSLFGIEDMITENTECDIPEIDNDIISNTTKAGQYDKTKMPINIGSLLFFMGQDEQKGLGDNFGVYYSENINDNQDVINLAKQRISELADEIRGLM
ncbi:MAG: hypothetical protein PHX22_11455 [Dysgonamonadaceae bacterium]|nr:hypothetical protein [Dysgonamonadaceae bacterium]